MKKYFFTVILLSAIVLGLIVGFFGFFPSTQASPPEFPGTGGVDTLEITCDETWKAAEVCYANGSGFTCTTNPESINAEAGSIGRVDAGTVDDVPYVRYHPKIRVTRWQVSGHAHMY